MAGLEPNKGQQAAVQSMNTQQMELGWFLNMLRNIANSGASAPAQPAQAGGIPPPPAGSPAANFLQMMQAGGGQNPNPQSGMEGAGQKQTPQAQPQQPKAKNSAAQNITAGASGDGAANGFLKALASLFGG